MRLKILLFVKTCGPHLPSPTHAENISERARVHRCNVENMKAQLLQNFRQTEDDNFTKVCAP